MTIYVERICQNDAKVHFDRWRSGVFQTVERRVQARKALRAQGKDPAALGADLEDVVVATADDDIEEDHSLNAYDSYSAGLHMRGSKITAGRTVIEPNVEAMKTLTKKRLLAEHPEMHTFFTDEYGDAINCPSGFRLYRCLRRGVPNTQNLHEARDVVDEVRDAYENTFHAVRDEVLLGEHPECLEERSERPNKFLYSTIAITL